MRKQFIALCVALIAGLTGCTTESPGADRKRSAEPTDVAPSVADFVGRTKKETQDDLTGTGTVFGFRDTSSEPLSGDEYDSWIVCKQDVRKEPVHFTVAASREACDLPAASPSAENASPSRSSPSPEAEDSPAEDPTADRDSRYAAAVKAQAPRLEPVADDLLGVQGQLACTLLKSGDSPKSVLETMQYGYPGDVGRVMVIEAPPVYCTKYTAEVERALK
ncbi:hypothetical protein AB0I22_21795 [Streptomyces sp. NPDC050610]|uniref:hypothetical protein n=1 Tax=Streptomyces sp. NPDC050610 TaxID=3157097 RepID=UPI003425AC1D